MPTAAPSVPAPKPAFSAESHGQPRPQAATPAVMSHAGRAMGSLSAHPLTPFQRHLPGQLAAGVEMARERAADRHAMLERQRGRPDSEATSGRQMQMGTAIVPLPSSASVRRGVQALPSGGGMLPALLQTSTLLGGSSSTRARHQVEAAMATTGQPRHAGSSALALRNMPGGVTTAPPPPPPLPNREVTEPTMGPPTAASGPGIHFAIPPGVLAIAQIVGGQNRGQVEGRVGAARASRAGSGGRTYVRGPDTHRDAQIAMTAAAVATADFQRDVNVNPDLLAVEAWEAAHPWEPPEPGYVLPPLLPPPGMRISHRATGILESRAARDAQRAHTLATSVLSEAGSLVDESGGGDESEYVTMVRGWVTDPRPAYQVGFEERAGQMVERHRQEALSLHASTEPDLVQDHAPVVQPAAQPGIPATGPPGNGMPHTEDAAQGPSRASSGDHDMDPVD